MNKFLRVYWSLELGILILGITMVLLGSLLAMANISRAKRENADIENGIVELIEADMEEYASSYNEETELIECETEISYSINDIFYTQTDNSCHEDPFPGKKLGIFVNIEDPNEYFYEKDVKSVSSAMKTSWIPAIGAVLIGIAIYIFKSGGSEDVFIENNRGVYASHNIGDNR